MSQCQSRRHSRKPRAKRPRVDARLRETPSQSSLEPRRRFEITVILSLAAAVVFFLALITYDPSDLSRAGDKPWHEVNNLVGVPGAVIAGVLHVLFGRIAYVLPVLVLIVGVFGRRRGNSLAFPIKCAALIFLLCSICALLCLRMDQADQKAVFSACGICGAYFGHWMLTFGPGGSTVLLVSFTLVSLLLSTSILFGDLARGAAQWIGNRLFVGAASARSTATNNSEPRDAQAASRNGNKRRRRLALPSPELEAAEPPPTEVEWEEIRDPETVQLTMRDILLDDGLSRAEQGKDRLVMRDDPVFDNWLLKGSLFDATEPEPPPPATPVKRRHSGKPATKRKKVPEEEGPSLLDPIALTTPLEYVISTKMHHEEPAGGDSAATTTVEAALTAAVENDATDQSPALSANTPFRLPTLNLLESPQHNKAEVLREEIDRTCIAIKNTFEEFGINARVVEVNYGPVITRYQIAPPPGVHLSRIAGLADNLAMNLKAQSVRIETPIPGKGTVGVEVPNATRVPVLLSETLAADEFRAHKSPLRVALGKTIEGEPFVADLATMPHLLIAGATGAGKSVCINTIITSILYTNTPDEVKFLMVDPKRVELQLYAGIPHLLHPVITDPEMAGGVLKWAVAEMEYRYDCLSRLGCRGLQAYNAKRKAELERSEQAGNEEPESRQDLPASMPYIVLIIDELADLMMVCRADVEASVQRLAQMARAVGIHLVLATQRPSVNVLTGVIKANLPTRIAFQVTSKIDSRTILDENGAEALLGRGDMLFRLGGAAKPVRVQGAYVTTEEVERVVKYIRAQRSPQYQQIEIEPSCDGGDDDEPADDALYEEAVKIVLDHGAASTSLLQRRLKIGYGRAARLLDIMEKQGIVGPARGSKPREVLSGSVR